MKIRKGKKGEVESIKKGRKEGMKEGRNGKNIKIRKEGTKGKRS